MKEFTVELYFVEWCGYSEDYTVMATDEADAINLAIEEHSPDFCEKYHVMEVNFGEYAEFCDIDEDGDAEEENLSSINGRVLS